MDTHILYDAYLTYIANNMNVKRNMVFGVIPSGDLQRDIKKIVEKLTTMYVNLCLLLVWMDDRV